MNKNGGTHGWTVGSVEKGIVFVRLNDFEMVDVFFCALTYVFSIWARSTGESEGLKKRYMTNTTTWREVDVMKKTWTDESSVCKACFFVGLLYRFGNSSPFYPKQLYKYML